MESFSVLWVEAGIFACPLLSHLRMELAGTWEQGLPRWGEETREVLHIAPLPSLFHCSWGAKCGGEGVLLKPPGAYPLASAPAYGQAGDQIQHYKPRSVILNNRRSCHTLRAGHQTTHPKAR